MDIIENLERTTRAAYSGSCPVTVDDLKKHLRVYSDSENDLMQAFIETAIEEVEDHCLKTILETTYTLRLSAFPAREIFGLERPIYLPRPPVASITSFKYKSKETGLDVSMVPGTDYLAAIRGNKPALHMVRGSEWPDSLVADEPDSITIVYVAETTVVPFRVKLAIKLMAATMWRYRESHTPAEIKEMNGFMSICALLNKERRFEW